MRTDSKVFAFNEYAVCVRSQDEVRSIFLVWEEGIDEMVIDSHTALQKDNGRVAR